MRIKSIPECARLRFQLFQSGKSSLMLPTLDRPSSRSARPVFLLLAVPAEGHTRCRVEEALASWRRLHCRAASCARYSGSCRFNCVRALLLWMTGFLKGASVVSLLSVEAPLSQPTHVAFQPFRRCTHLSNFFMQELVMAWSILAISMLNCLRL